MLERQESGRRPRIPAAVERDVLNEGSCAYCGETDFALTVDHIMPVSRGGTSERKNLTAACWPCNKEKLTFTPDEWKAWRLETGKPWPPQSRTAFVVATIATHWPRYLIEKAAEEAAPSHQQQAEGEDERDQEGGGPMSELTTRDQEIWRLEGEIIDAWHAADHKIPQEAFVVLLSGTKLDCQQTGPYADPQAAADRALDRLRRVAEAMRS